jgi:hypothetical protein
MRGVESIFNLLRLTVALINVLVRFGTKKLGILELNFQHDEEINIKKLQLTFKINILVQKSFSLSPKMYQKVLILQKNLIFAH